jgi:NAD dependent epimerase/dehydratase family enzyme
MEAAAVRPTVFVSASSVGTYGYSGFTDERYTESSPPGTDFWGQDSLEWEEAALVAEQLGVRTVLPRTGYVWMRVRGEGSRSRRINFGEASVALCCPENNGCPGFIWPMRWG